MWDTTRLRDAVSYLNFRQGSSDKILLFFPIFVYTSAFLDSTVSLSEGVILQLRRIRRSLDVDSVATLVHAFDASRVDYCGSLLIGAPRKTTDKLQHVLNSTAWIVSNTRKFDRGLTHFRRSQLHWLDVVYRVRFRVCVQVFRCLHKMAAEYLSTYCQPVSGISGPSNWNTLPAYLRDSSLSLSFFKHHFKTFLFSFY